MTRTCPVCLNNVQSWSMGQMTYKIGHHYRNDGALCPGSDQVRSEAR